MKSQTFTIAATITVILLIFSASSSPILLAQEGRGTGRLVGFVMDTDKNPVEGVKLTLEYLKYSNRLTTTSDEKGKWIFQGIGPGDVRVTAEKDGFAKGGIGLYVSGANRNPKQHITLKRLSEVPKSELKEDDKNAAARSSFKKADALFNERKFEDALALYRDFQKMQPELYKIGINIANCYLEMTQYDQAVEEYQKVLDK